MSAVFAGARQPFQTDMVHGHANILMKSGPAGAVSGSSAAAVTNKAAVSVEEFEAFVRGLAHFEKLLATTIPAAAAAGRVTSSDPSLYQGGVLGTDLAQARVPCYADPTIELTLHVTTHFLRSTSTTSAHAASGEAAPAAVLAENEARWVRALSNDWVGVVWCDGCQRDLLPSSLASANAFVVVAVHPHKDTQNDTSGDNGQPLGTSEDGPSSRLYRIQVLTKEPLRLSATSTGPLCDGCVGSSPLLPLLVRQTALNAWNALRREAKDELAASQRRETHLVHAMAAAHQASMRPVALSSTTHAV